MTDRNALDGFVDLMIDVASPLADVTADRRTFASFLARMGWTAQTIDVEALDAAVDALMKALVELQSNTSLETLEDLIKTLSSLAQVAVSLGEFANSVASSAGSSASAEVLLELTADILQQLLLTWISRSSPVAYSVLELVGLIDFDVPTAVSTGGDAPLLQRIAAPRPVLRFDALGQLLQDPPTYLAGRLGVNDLQSEEDAQWMLYRLFVPLRDLVIQAGGLGVAGIEDLDPAVLAADDVRRRQAAFLIPLPPVDAGGEPVFSSISLVTELVPKDVVSLQGDHGPGISLTPAGQINVGLDLPRSRLELGLTAEVVSVFIPGIGSPVAHGATNGVHIHVGYALVPPAEGAPAVALGSDTLALTISGFHAGVESRFGRPAPDDKQVDIDIHAAVEKALFVLKPGEGDGFLSKVLPADGLNFGFDLGVGWSNRRGVYFSGGASLEVEFPLHVSLLGVLTIDIVHLLLAVDTAGFRIAIGASASLQLGPISASVQRMGIQANATFPTAGKDFEIKPAFWPPRGAGMVIDASVVKGGGFILNDPDNGRYAGILQLKIADIVTVTAIGLVTTRMPDGSEGFSLLVIITAAFPPIPLGFGFSLAGLGGLLGLNRTMNVQALRDGVRTGVLDSILFPIDPVARANKVISDVESVFPVARDRFVIGVMVRIGWGSPQFVSADIGIIVELPMPLRIALIGRIGMVLPDKEAAIVVLNLDVVGILDLGRSEISIDATIHDSRIAIFDIYGDMAVRIGWGASPAFAISIGGFSPRFVPPPDFPQMRRLTIALATSDNPSIRLETYFAITSNTLQVGARLDAHAHLDAGFVGLFSVDAYFGFDALIVFSPFEFIVELCGGIVIKRNDVPFLGAEIALMLSGPQPMRAVGHAEVHFIATFRIPFDVTVGEEAPVAAIAAVDPMGALLEALGRTESWSALPPTTEPGVALRQVPAKVLLAHPMGQLAVRQRVVPLDITIERYGGVPIDGGPRSYSLTSYEIGGESEAKTADLRDAWAPGDLFTLTDDEKLSRPSFEQLLSGATGIAAPKVQMGPERHGAAEAYETSVIDGEDPLPQSSDAYEASTTVANLLAKMAAASTDVTGSYSGPAMKVSVSESSYVVASTRDLSAIGDSHPSWLEAHQARASAANVQVVATHEVTS